RTVSGKTRSTLANAPSTAAPAGAQQPQGERQRLILGEHQGWQLESTAKLVATIATALAFDRYSQLLEHGHIASDRTLIYLQAPGQLPTAESPSRLQKL